MNDIAQRQKIKLLEQRVEVYQKRISDLEDVLTMLRDACLSDMGSKPARIFPNICHKLQLVEIALFHKKE